MVEFSRTLLHIHRYKSHRLLLLICCPSNVGRACRSKQSCFNVNTPVFYDQVELQVTAWLFLKHKQQRDSASAVTIGWMA